jgi:hypothetical protein
MGYLRAHAGERFSAQVLATKTGHPVAAVIDALNSRYSMGAIGLFRERTSGSSYNHTRYWIAGDAGTGSHAQEARLIGRWMLRHPRAVVPSVIAKALGIPVRHVAEELDRWTEDGTAVRCELITRRGFDRFEYRLSYAPAGAAPSRRAQVQDAQPAA